MGRLINAFWPIVPADPVNQTNSLPKHLDSPYSNTLTSNYSTEAFNPRTVKSCLVFSCNEPLGGETPPGVASTAEAWSRKRRTAVLCSEHTSYQANTSGKYLDSWVTRQDSSTGTYSILSTMGKGGGTFDRLLGTLIQHLLTLMGY